MNLADALKKLYTKLGGTDTLPQGTDTCTLVDKIADEVSGGGSSGGGKAIYLTPTIDGDTLRLGKTYNEIVDFAENGNTIWGVFDSIVGSGVNMILLTKYSHENNRYSASFIADTIKLVFTASSPTNELVINKNV